MQRAERLMKLLELLHGQAGTDAETLARACGVSSRTLQRDLDALGAAGFPVYFHHGYQLAAPALLPPVTLTVDQALALRLVAQSAAFRTESATGRALSLAAKKLDQALAAQPLWDRSNRQLALPVQDPRADASATALTKAITEGRTVRIMVASRAKGESPTRRIDPYRLLPASSGLVLLGYSHERRRIIRIPLARVKSITMLQRRFQPVPGRVLERHLHRDEVLAPGLRWIRLLCRPPLVQALRKHPPVGSLMWEDGPDGSVVFTVGAERPEDLLPWLLACGEAIEVLEPRDLRQEILRTARALSERYTARPGPAPEPGPCARRSAAGPTSEPAS